MIDITCGFCSEYYRCDNSSNLFDNMLKQRFKTPSRIIIDSSACYVLPTIGCFVEGYSLIVSKRHVGSIGRLNYEEQDAFIALINRLKENSLETYNKPVICFEHGAAILIYLQRFLPIFLVLVGEMATAEVQSGK